MDSLSYSFVIFKCCGLWRSTKRSEGWETIIYNSYTCFAIFLIYTFTISEFVDLLGSFDNVEEFANGSFMLLSMIGVCGKAANLLKERCTVIELTNVLENQICRPRSAEEIQIQKKCDRDTR